MDSRNVALFAKNNGALSFSPLAWLCDQLVISSEERKSRKNNSQGALSTHWGKSQEPGAHFQGISPPQSHYCDYPIWPGGENSRAALELMRESPISARRAHARLYIGLDDPESCLPKRRSCRWICGADVVALVARSIAGEGHAPRALNRGACLAGPRICGYFMFLGGHGVET